MGFTYQEAKDRLECPHINCEYYQVESDISGTYVENKLTLEKSCLNCQGQDHLMFDVGSYKTEVEEVSVGDKLLVNNSSITDIRAYEGDKLTVTAIAENPMNVDNPLVSNSNIVVSVGRNLQEESPYRVGLIGIGRLRKLLSKGTVERHEQ